VSLIEQYTAESAEVTQAMAREVLAKTPEATISAAITGHFGPDAPQEMDGVVFIAVSRRVADKIVQVTCIRRELAQTDRLSRQLEASQLVIKQIQSSLQ
jgi:nicotinamide-nucleotide amidase